MDITLKLFANLRELLPAGSQGGECALEVKPGSRVDSIIRLLKIPEDMKLIILLNSRHADQDTVLKHGDVLAVFPPLAGG